MNKYVNENSGNLFTSYRRIHPIDVTAVLSDTNTDDEATEDGVEDDDDTAVNEGGNCSDSISSSTSSRSSIVV